MVFKALVSGASGNLNTAGDSYGYFNDTIYVVYEGIARSYNDIFSYGGNDIIDLRDASSGNQHLVYSGRGNDMVLGGDGNDHVFDTDGNDVILLGGNSDLVTAGAGNDVYDGGAGFDRLFFEDIYNNLGLAVTNTVGVECDLKIIVAQNFGPFGFDVIRSFENVEGGAGSDHLLGTEGPNEIHGRLGNDLLEGRNGRDTIYGGNGADRLVGGRGADIMDCGIEIDDHRDYIRYTAINESGIGTSITAIDSIYVFDQGGGATDDRIDLSRIDARASTTAVNEAFVFRGSSAFNQPGGEIRLEVVGLDTLVHIDNDGDAATEMNILIIGVIGLTAVEFIL